MPSNTLFSAQARKRQHAGELILDGFDNDEIAEVLQCSIRAVSRWRKKLKENNDDLCTLLRKKGTGQPPRLNDEQKHLLKEIILKGTIAAGYPTERWMSKNIADLIQKTFNITLAPRTVRCLLRHLGLSPQMPIVQSSKRDQQAIERWKNETIHEIKKKQKKRICALFSWTKADFRYRRSVERSGQRQASRLCYNKCIHDIRKQA